MPARWTHDALRTSLNAILPRDIWIAGVAPVASDFHPRYDAVRRTYRYEVGTIEASASPFHRSWCWPLGQPLDSEALTAAADLLVGEHRFERFAKAGQPERGYDCTVVSATWSETPIGVRFEVSADRYLHHMVRYLVGTMVEVARARRPLHDVTRLLVCDPDVVTSPPAPAEGLFLHRVDYPGDLTSA
jgi:tRNA pseudouridine38-40 synthase